MWCDYIISIDLPTEPEFAFHVAESFLVAGPVAVEIDGTVLSSLEHLYETINFSISFTTNAYM